jgi:hypothetical protein
MERERGAEASRTLTRSDQTSRESVDLTGVCLSLVCLFSQPTQRNGELTLLLESSITFRPGFLCGPQPGPVHVKGAFK